MTTPKAKTDQFDDVEKPHLVVVEPSGDEAPAPLTVRLRDPWSDFHRPADKRGPSNAMRSPSALTLLDDMKGVLQWD